MAKNPFYQLDVIRNASQKGNVISDCYRLMYKKELWIKAYAKIYPNAGNLPTGSSIVAIDETIEHLKTGTFRFTSERSEEIQKFNSNKMLFGEPNLRNLLVLEVMRMILTNIFEPIFSACSHGFREARSCHSALYQIKDTWKELTWCITGDFKDFYEHLDHSVLIKLVAKKINDHRFLLLIHNALKSGIMEYTPNRKPFNSTKRGSRISHLLASIYLHEFDLFMEKQINAFDKRKIRLDKECKHIKIHSPASSLVNEYKRVQYVRYANSFVIGIASSKQNALNMKDTILNFLKVELHLCLSDEKMRVTHLENPTSFLGYMIRKQNTYKLNQTTGQRDPFKISKHRSEIKLEIPEQKLKEFAITNGYGNLDRRKIMHRAKLLNKSELEIMYIYNTELRGIANYYKLADNFHRLAILFYLAESSFIKTIANKRRSTSMKVTKSMKRHKQGKLCLLSEDKQGMEKLHQFVKLKDLLKEANKEGSPEMEKLPEIN